jgi:hypothetical protein
MIVVDIAPARRRHITHGAANPSSTLSTTKPAAYRGAVSEAEVGGAGMSERLQRRLAIANCTGSSLSRQPDLTGLIPANHRQRPRRLFARLAVAQRPPRDRR